MSIAKNIDNTPGNRTSILDMAQGSYKERADIEMAYILDNIADVNTDAKKKRTLTIEISFLPDEQRRALSVSTTVKSKTVPMSPIATLLQAVPDGNGEMQYVEATVQAPGQFDVFGGQQEEPKILKFAKGE